MQGMDLGGKVVHAELVGFAFPHQGQGIMRDFHFHVTGFHAVEIDPHKQPLRVGIAQKSIHKLRVEVGVPRIAPHQIVEPAYADGGMFYPEMQ